MFRIALLIALLCTAACSAPATPVATTSWERLAEHAPYPESYNFPVHVAPDGRFIALHPAGTWASRDGATWEKAPLPASGSNTAYLATVEHEGATWVLGRHTGSYAGFTIDPLIRRTSDYIAWQDVGRSTTLPRLIFYAAVSFRDELWILGGYRDGREVAEVWRSANGVDWTRVAEAPPWSARSNASAVVFRGRMWLIGGGVIDGAIANDTWSSADGVSWRRETESIAPENPVGYAAVVHDDRLWLIGANRSGRFSSELLVSEDGRTFTAARAPWSPRGGVAAWSYAGALYITGGKFSVERNGEHIFSYSNDVWRLDAD